MEDRDKILEHYADFNKEANSLIAMFDAGEITGVQFTQRILLASEILTLQIKIIERDVGKWFVKDFINTGNESSTTKDI
jgi:hypothetical protein